MMKPNRVAIELIQIELCVLLCNQIVVVQTADCRTHENCRGFFSINRNCCGGSLGGNKRSCQLLGCLGTYCSIESDCGDPSLCCRSNKCVNIGCSGCTKDNDCYTGHVCCRSTFSLAQTVCSVNCINQVCQWNNDCSGKNNECCRSKKCVQNGCSENCQSNSECFKGQYCCRRSTASSTGLGCRSSCVGEICSSDDDCGGPNECCISNKCVTAGCSGCYNNSDCYSGQYCCKQTFPFNQRFCSAKCINESCNWNDDCSGRGECCRSGKCVSKGCHDRCKSNSECRLDEYCCKKSTSGDGCRQSCVGEICSSNDDCGGPNECCISSKCVTAGCSGCNANTDCADGHYCCGGNNNDLGKCRSDCIGIACASNDQCGNNICGSKKICEMPSKSPEDSSPPWQIAVIAVCIVLFLTALAVVVFKYHKRRRAGNATQAHRETVALQTILKQGTPLSDTPPTNETSGFNKLLQHQESKFQNPRLAHTNKNNDESHEPNYEPLRFRNEEEDPRYIYQSLNQPSTPNNSPCQANENQRYVNFPQNNQGKPDPISQDLTQEDNEGYMILGPRKVQ